MNEIDKLKSKIEGLKVDLRVAESKEKETLESLKQYGIKNVDDAETRLKTLSKEIDNLQEEKDILFEKANKILNDMEEN